ncbi:major facilitator superfamily domain-containing protein [Syncephalastrum racemosum]|uniref:Major facilitator superfamily domain-containing protein n=1 Tax=Syncephalastrum racemosum TaxID=13706 RepID=A0A1X2HNA8_SYNRA|nr:major facilitator superfamily domain-containing protein [Syncephalastrum racemosum]
MTTLLSEGVSEIQFNNIVREEELAEGTIRLEDDHISQAATEKGVQVDYLGDEFDDDEKTQEVDFMYDPDGDDAPEGGYGWLVLLGAFLSQFALFGIMFSWGILQDYFQRNMFGSEAQTQLSFAGTIMELGSVTMGPFFQILVSKFGLTAVMIFGSVIATLGLELASLSTQIWHLYLTQGVLFGVGASFMYVMAMGIAPQWFNRKRALSQGIISSGVGTGGLVMPFIIDKLNNNLGIQWNYRILGFIVFGINAITCVLVKERKSAKSSPGERKTIRELFDFSILKNTNYVIYLFAFIISMWGFYIPFFFLPSYATYLGMRSEDGSAFMSVLSASSCIGRLCMGFAGDRIGRLNTNTYNMLMGFSVLFGLTCSSCLVFMTPISCTIVGLNRFPTALSILLLGNIISVFGPTIASAIGDNLETIDLYFFYKIFAGAAYLVGGALLCLLKFKMTKGVFTKI